MSDRFCVVVTGVKHANSQAVNWEVGPHQSREVGLCQASGNETSAAECVYTTR